MKAAVFKQRDEMAVIDVPAPKAGAGEVILKVHNCGICGSDLHAVQYGMGLRPDTVMGHEFCGEIHELGAGVSGFRKGERVTALPFISCGECDRCGRDDGMHCERTRGLGLGQLPGGYAEFVMCGASSLLKLPDKVSSREGALVEPLSVGLHGVNRANLKEGMGVVVMGAGPIGLSATIWARAKGATVVVSELAAGRKDLAMKLGASAVVNPKQESPAKKVSELTGRLPDVVFECIGATGTFAEAVNYAQRGGRVVVIGVCMSEDGFPPMMAMSKELDVRFSLGLAAGEIETAIEMLAAGRVNSAPMITHTLGLDDFPRAFAALSRPTDQTKVMLEFQG
ncbi:MAG: zinc-dependent alcohol dehydrogenase [Pseudomonadota bacterium]